MSVAEFLALGFTGYLVYYNHFIGFILMAASMCILCVSRPDGGRLWFLWKYAPTVYKGMYYVYNPLGYILLFAAAVLCQTERQYYICQYVAGLVVIILSMAFFMFVAHRKYKHMIRQKIETKDVAGKL